MGINDEDVAAVRAASDIVAIVSQYVPLRKVGAQHMGRCPFHSDNTASFSVNGQTNVYHCFGCQVGGDVIDFVQRQENLTFPDAVEWLAARANVTLRYDDPHQGEGRRKRARLYDTLERAVEWYHQRLLTGSDAGAARRYLRGRGIDGDTVREFRIGWAPDGRDELCRALRLDEATARDTGLGRISRGRVQDHFRARILFPIADDQGRTISFGGRILPGGEGPGNRGKYWNTTETPLYVKSRVLYGLDRAKKAMVSADTVVVCEGYTDVIGFHRVGVPLAVAPCGTALTDDHVKLLRRFARKFVLAFDADGAGQAAAERFYRWEREHDLEVGVADLPPGQDPGDVAQTDPERLPASVEAARPFMRFRLDRAFAAADLSTPEGRARIAQRAIAIVAEHPDELVRDQYALDVAARCRVDPDLMRRRLADEVRAVARRPAGGSASSRSAVSGPSGSAATGSSGGRLGGGSGTRGRRGGAGPGRGRGAPSDRTRPAGSDGRPPGRSDSGPGDGRRPPAGGPAGGGGPPAGAAPGAGDHGESAPAGAGGGAGAPDGAVPPAGGPSTPAPGGDPRGSGPGRAAGEARRGPPDRGADTPPPGDPGAVPVPNAPEELPPDFGAREDGPPPGDPRGARPGGPQSGPSGSDTRPGLPTPPAERRRSPGASQAARSERRAFAADRKRPALEVLRHALHNPAGVGAWLSEAVFDEPAHVAVFRLLVEHETHEAARAAAPPEAAALLSRLLVEEPTHEPLDSLCLLLRGVVQREMRLLNATSAEDPDAVLRDTIALREMLSGLDHKDPRSATQSADRLLAWLEQRVGDGG